ncbi:MAG: hypothetical protein CMQ20_07485 [Gammaproteobacteria bacterium]|nr:hypothetical protein [Gammaproteobacteria bacterium]
MVGKNFPRGVFFGDTHLHTNLSPDAAAGGNRLFGHDEVYKLAMGKEVTAHNGRRVRLNRPLDFLVAADHAEYMGLFPALDSKNPDLLATEVGKRWHQMLQSGPKEAANILIEFGNALRNGEDLVQSDRFQKSVWQTVIDKAEAYNQPGVFTAFIGYEWSSSRGGGNMHRIVLFKDGADKTNQITPFSSFNNNRPQALWKFLAAYEEKTGGHVFAIPHNSNVSAGLMFAPVDSDGNTMTVEYVKQRVKWEPLLEVTQYKGDSETHPAVSPDDEFADYESWDKFASFSDANKQEDWMYEREYARPALRNGLAMSADIGDNPFKFGLIGSTDSHTGISSADENNFWGKFSWHEPNPTRAMERFVNIPDMPQFEWEMAASGLAAIWAQENTRASLFDAMRRRETYATTGPRMRVRVFGGWDFTDADLNSPDWVERGYLKGVPMGADLPLPPNIDQVPVFIIKTWKDPIGANLDRVQIVKGWLDTQGRTHEKVFDIALSDDRSVSPVTGKAPPVGTTVDLSKPTYRNDIGEVQFTTRWTDPSFHIDEPSFYYVRVLEIPTPRWTAYDAAYFNLEMPAHVPMVTQERAYTSPIWFTPEQ